MMRVWWFEFWYGIFGPVTAAMQVWFTFYAVLDRFLPRKVVLILAIPFIVVDVIYNILIGTILFLDLPREMMLTTRLKRLDKKGVYGVRRFKKVLNWLDSGHV